MTLDDELRIEAEDEIEARNSYRGLSARLRAAGHLHEATLVDNIASEEGSHANTLMTMANSVRAREAFGRLPEEIKLGGTMVEIPLGRPPFPKTYGDWVDLAEDIKAKYPDDPVMKASVNYQLGQISEETEEAEEAKRWLVAKAGKAGIK